MVDSGITYRDCDKTEVVQDFHGQTDLEALAEQCWQLDNVEAPSNVLVDEGDLVMRVSDPGLGLREQWQGDDQAPLVYQRFEGDFLMVTRVEALNKLTTDHCLEPGNMAGLVVRRTEPQLEWATFLIGPFVPDVPAPGLDCAGEADVAPPTLGQVRSRNDVWGVPFDAEGPMQTGIGVDVEADIAVCRLQSTLSYFYRDPKVPLGTDNDQQWQLIGAHSSGNGPLQVGLTVSGRDPSYQIEGHFQWVGYTDQLGADNCLGALNRLPLAGLD